jgi:cell division control protein 45
MSSTELYGRSKTTNSEARQNPWNLSRGDQIRDVLRDEVRRLNPVPASDIARERDEAGGIIPTSARSPTDTSIRLSPEPRFLLIRHWSLYESMYASFTISIIAIAYLVRCWKETIAQALGQDGCFSS